MASFNDVTIYCSLAIVAIVCCTCAMGALDVNDDVINAGSSDIDYRGAGLRSSGYNAARLHQLQLLTSGRLPVGAAPSRSNDKRSDDQSTAFDVDYGWGGGRFGKRRDALGMAGRFGRSVPDHIDIDSNRN